MCTRPDSPLSNTLRNGRCIFSITLILHPNTTVHIFKRRVATAKIPTTTGRKSARPSGTQTCLFLRIRRRRRLSHGICIFFTTFRSRLRHCPPAFPHFNCHGRQIEKRELIRESPVVIHLRPDAPACNNFMRQGFDLRSRRTPPS